MSLEFPKGLSSVIGIVEVFSQRCRMSDLLFLYPLKGFDIFCVSESGLSDHLGSEIDFSGYNMIRKETSRCSKNYEGE